MKRKPDFAKYFILKPKSKRDVGAWQSYSRWMQKRCSKWWHRLQVERSLSHFGFTLEDSGADPKDIMVGTI